MLFLRLEKVFAFIFSSSAAYPIICFRHDARTISQPFYGFIKITILDHFNKFEYVAALATAETFEKFLLHVA